MIYMKVSVILVSVSIGLYVDTHTWLINMFSNIGVSHAPSFLVEGIF